MMPNCVFDYAPWRMYAGRFGYRRLLIFLRREGFMVNHKRLFRLYREERLMVRR
jgi:helix-turn-helix protein